MGPIRDAGEKNDGTRRILVVEDEPVLRAAIAHRLQWEGYAVIEAVDAVGATTAAREHRPDLVILDYLLPGGDRSEVSRRLQRILCCRAPVIFMGGLAPDRVLAETLQLWGVLSLK